MAKGYWIAHVDIHDPDTYRQYVAANGPVFAQHGAHFLVRAGAFENPEGRSRSRHVVIEFPSHAAALACYHSPEYQALVALRASAGQADVVIVEGYDGPQPQG